MSSLRSPKTLTEWEELDYFRRPRPLKALWKPVLLSTLAVGVLAMVALAVLQKKVAPGLAMAYQAGTLSSAHALFNNDCSKCHVEAFKTWDRLWQFNSAVRAVSDETCKKCHPGPIHNAMQIRQDSCVSCHREHHGRARLDQVPDAHCTACHADLTNATRATRPLYRDVPSFAAHPPFAQRWEGAPKDPGTIAFNHAAHLDPDGVLTPFKDLPAQDGDRREQRKRLECKSCHEPDEAGRYMKPISYEKHCKECHPLTVSIPVKNEGAGEALAQFSSIPAPHQPPDMVRAVLRDRLTLFIQKNPQFLKARPLADSNPPRPIPGSKPGRPEVVSKEQFEWVGRQLIEVEKPLFASRTGCALCHQEIKPLDPLKGELPRYALSRINQRSFPVSAGLPAGETLSSRWFPHSRFRHDSHRMLDCTQCHDARKSRLSSDLLLPGIDNCRKCHDARPGASARSDCVECHTYHPDAEKKANHGKLTIDEVLGLKKERPNPLLHVQD
jgi:hypothetical protein